MEIIVFLLMGLIAGWFAGVVVKGHSIGVVGDIVVGIVGAFVGGYIFRMMGVSAIGFIENVAMAAVGAVVFLFILRFIVRLQAPRI